jgi:hypothetical protein
MSRHTQTRSYGTQREFRSLRSGSTHTQTPKGPVQSIRGQWPPLERKQNKAARRMRMRTDPTPTPEDVKEIIEEP